MSGSVTAFEQAASTLRLSDRAKGQAWEQLLQLRIGAEDPEAIRVLLHVAMQEDAERIKGMGREVLEEATGTIQNAARETAERLGKSAARVEKASLAKMQASKAELSASLGTEIAEAANKALTRKVAVLERSTLAAWVATCLVLAALLGWGGYLYGKRNAEASIAAVQSMLQREDGAAWAQLMASNNLTGTLASYCPAGSGNVRRVDGGVICGMSLWLQRDGVVGNVAGRPMEGVGVLSTLSAWLAAWGPWTLLAVGALFVLLVRKVVRAVTKWGPLRWLFDIPAPVKDPRDAAFSYGK